MSNRISTLLLRNLSDVFGENDPVRRRAAIDEIFHEDAVFYDPKGGVFRGRDEIDRIAGVIKATHPDFEYQPLFPPEELGDAGRVRWVSGHSLQTTSLRGNRFYRRPERSHCFRSISFSTIFLKAICATSMRSNALLKQSAGVRPAWEPPRIRCPLCGWSPQTEDHWFCTCGHQGNMFDTGACAPRACTSGLELSASRAADGRRTHSGMHLREKEETVK